MAAAVGVEEVSCVCGPHCVSRSARCASEWHVRSGRRDLLAPVLELHERLVRAEWLGATMKVKVSLLMRGKP